MWSFQYPGHAPLVSPVDGQGCCVGTRALPHAIDAHSRERGSAASTSRGRSIAGAYRVASDQQLPPVGYRSHLWVMNLDLTEEETAALLKELDDIIDGDRYILSPRIKTLKAIRAKIRPEPAREPLPPAPKRYAPPRATAARRRRRALSLNFAEPERVCACACEGCNRGSFPVSAGGEENR